VFKSQALLFLALLSSSAVAQDTHPNNSGLIGIGSVSCTEYLQESNSNKSFSAIWLVWAQAFLSGVNAGEYRAAGDDLIPIPDGELIQKFASAYCAENPKGTSFQALLGLFDVLKYKHSAGKAQE
jgi:hypothetical protein